MKWLLLIAMALTFWMADLPTICDEPDPVGLVEPPVPVTKG